MSKLKHRDKANRKRKYDKLIAVGFNSRLANRYKDFSEYKVDLLIEEKQKAEEKMRIIVVGRK